MCVSESQYHVDDHCLDDQLRRGATQSQQICISESQHQVDDYGLDNQLRIRAKKNQHACFCKEAHQSCDHLLDDLERECRPNSHRNHCMHARVRIHLLFMSRLFRWLLCCKHPSALKKTEDSSGGSFRTNVSVHSDKIYNIQKTPVRPTSQCTHRLLRHLRQLRRLISRKSFSSLQHTVTLS